MWPFVKPIPVSELKPGKVYTAQKGNGVVLKGDRVWLDMDGYLHCCMVPAPWKQLSQRMAFLTPQDIEEGAANGVKFVPARKEAQL